MKPSDLWNRLSTDGDVELHDEALWDAGVLIMKEVNARSLLSSDIYEQCYICGDINFLHIVMTDFAWTLGEEEVTAIAGIVVAELDAEVGYAAE